MTKQDLYVLVFASGLATVVTKKQAQAEILTKRPLIDRVYKIEREAQFDIINKAVVK
jgi:hypothetical protein